MGSVIRIEQAETVFSDEGVTCTFTSGNDTFIFFSTHSSYRRSMEKTMRAYNAFCRDRPTCGIEALHVCPFPSRKAEGRCGEH